jgi:hypothetical protein
MGSMMSGMVGFMLLWLLIAVALLGLAVAGGVWAVRAVWGTTSRSHPSSALPPRATDPLRDASVADSVRASHTDREHTVAVLQAHTDAGRLTVDDFDRRSTQATEARTVGQLRSLLTDLPR